MASRSLVNSLIRKQTLLTGLNKLNYLAAPCTTAALATQSSNSLVVLKREPAAVMYDGGKRFIHLTSYRLNTIVVESPEFAESVKEGDISFLKKVGDSVQEDEIIANVATDKTTIEIKAPKAGVIEALLVEDGSTIGGRSPVLKLKVGAAGAASPAPPAASKPAAAAPEAPKPAAAAASKPAPEQAAAPTTPPPLPKAPASFTPVSSVPVTPLKATTSITGETTGVDINKISGTRTETRIKMSRMRQTVASRLKEAQNTTAMLTTFNEINMENLTNLRKQYGEQFQKKHNLKLGFMSAFVKAAATALQDQPIVNAAIEKNEIVYRDYVDVSVAVATPKGLVVPVLRNVERMSYADIEKEIASLSERARQNKLAIEDMQGGTFTISNGGVFGSMFGTPIINLPQSAILGMHGIFDRPVAINGQVVIKPMMYIALTYDHRLIDGREAVTFLRKIKSGVEDPRTLLLDI